jgi:hypothetical protein
VVKPLGLARSLETPIERQKSQTASHAGDCVSLFREPDAEIRLSGSMSVDRRQSHVEPD